MQIRHENILGKIVTWAILIIMLLFTLMPIIFMVTATVITPGSINIPRAGQSSKAPDNPVTVMIAADGAITADGGKNGPNLQNAGEGDIFAAISDAAKGNPDLAVMVAADKDIAYQKVIDVTSRLRQAGVARVGLAVR